MLRLRFDAPEVTLAFAATFPDFPQQLFGSPKVLEVMVLFDFKQPVGYQELHRQSIDFVGHVLGEVPSIPSDF